MLNNKEAATDPKLHPPAQAECGAFGSPTHRPQEPEAV